MILQNDIIRFTAEFSGYHQPCSLMVWALYGPEISSASSDFK
jgi:hypothetical protein